MVVEVGEKIHIMARRRFEQDVRRHFVGTVIVSDSTVKAIHLYLMHTRIILLRDQKKEPESLTCLTADIS